MTWTREAEEKFFSRLRRTGNVSRAIEAAGVSRTYVYRKRANNRKFREKWREAMDEALDKLEARLWERALGMEDGGPSGKSIGPDERLAIFLLKAHRPEIFADGAQKNTTGSWTSADAAREKLLKKLDDISDRRKNDGQEAEGG